MAVLLAYNTLPFTDLLYKKTLNYKSHHSSKIKKTQNVIASSC